MTAKVKKTGFTLMEILIVMIIIALFTAILFPSLKKSKQMAARTNCASNLRQFGFAYQLYAADYGGRFPNIALSLYANPENCIYDRYIKNAKVFWCPANSHVLPPTGINNEINIGNWNNSYSFVFGLTASNSSAMMIPMISDRGIYRRELTYGNHPTGINVLYLDGSIHWINKDRIDYSAPDYVGNVACDSIGNFITITDKSAWGQ